MSFQGFVPMIYQGAAGIGMPSSANNNFPATVVVQNVGNQGSTNQGILKAKLGGGLNGPDLAVVSGWGLGAAGSFNDSSSIGMSIPITNFPNNGQYTIAFVTYRKESNGTETVVDYAEKTISISKPIIPPPPGDVEYLQINPIADISSGQQINVTWLFTINNQSSIPSGRYTAKAELYQKGFLSDTLIDSKSVDPALVHSIQFTAPQVQNNTGYKVKLTISTQTVETQFNVLPVQEELTITSPQPNQTIQGGIDIPLKGMFTRGGVGTSGWGWDAKLQKAELLGFSDVAHIFGNTKSDGSIDDHFPAQNVDSDSNYRITVGISSQNKVIDFKIGQAPIKPTILSGTSDPTFINGKKGDSVTIKATVKASPTGKPSYIFIGIKGLTDSFFVNQSPLQPNQQVDYSIPITLFQDLPTKDSLVFTVVTGLAPNGVVPSVVDQTNITDSKDIVVGVGQPNGGLPDLSGALTTALIIGGVIIGGAVAFKIFKGSNPIDKAIQFASLKAMKGI